jgi:DNA-binding NtrC family response regulator
MPAAIKEFDSFRAGSRSVHRVAFFDQILPQRIGHHRFIVYYKIEPVDLPFDNGSLPEGTTQGMTWDVPPNMTLEDIEKLVIEKTLQRTNGNKQAAANLLGIYRPRLYSKIRKYNIDVAQLVAS